jgi:phospholipid/cholesterol/gamma-HCH transport system permease protein
MPIVRLEQLGQTTVLTIANLLAAFGRFCDFSGKTFGWLFRSGFRWKSLRLLIPQMFEVGVKSVPVVGVTGAFIGMVMAIESYNSFKQLGQEARLGSVINLSVVKQIGPVLAAMMLAGRVGGALTAELGTMNVTEQLDAMRVMGADPIRYLVVPRFLACVLLTPILTIYSDLLGVLGGYIISVHYLGIPSTPYWYNSAMAIETWQIMEGIGKSVFFGAAIGLVACYKGFNSGAGASGVGKACTESFVASFIAIIVLNFFAARLLQSIYVGLYGSKGVFS